MSKRNRDIFLLLGLGLVLSGYGVYSLIIGKMWALLIILAGIAALTVFFILYYFRIYKDF